MAQTGLPRPWFDQRLMLAYMLKQSDLTPVNWAAIEPHYRAGIRSLRSLKAEFGVSPSAISKHFDKRGVKRDVKARVHFEAQRKVDRAAVNTKVNAEGEPTDEAIIDANAVVIAAVRPAACSPSAERVRCPALGSL